MKNSVRTLIYYSVFILYSLATFSQTEAVKRIISEGQKHNLVMQHIDV